MNIKRQNQYLILPKDGQREYTKLAVEYSEKQISEYLAQGYVLVSQDDFNKLIGNSDGEYLIATDGTVYPKPPLTEAEQLAVLKPAKIAELKAERDTREVEPIEYHGYKFDYDEKARERINAAIIALEENDGAINWTTADNKDVVVTAADLRDVIKTVANRSNDLHVAYRVAKEKVEAATTVAEVEAVTL